MQTFSKQSSLLIDLNKITEDTNHQQIAYSQAMTSNFKSLSDVLKKRQQFGKETEKIMKKLKKHKIKSSMAQMIIDNGENNITMGKNFICQDSKDQKQNETLLLSLALEVQLAHKLYNQTRNIEQKQKHVIDIRDVVSFYAHGKYYKFSKLSLGIFSNRSKIRQACVFLITFKPFDIFILTVIIFNSVLLGFIDYTGKESDYWANQLNNKIEVIFTSIFIAEALIKILAMGFILGKNAYLQDPWNWIDFSVVITSSLQQIPQMKNVSGLRTFRLFRPLKSLNSLPQMRILVGTLLSSLSQIGGILILQTFFFIIFAILGITIWEGSIHYRCRETPFPLNGDWIPIADDTEVCGSARVCPIGTCGSLLEANMEGFDLYQVSNLYRDTEIPQLNWGITSFDHIGYAILTIYQCISTDDWTSILTIFKNASSKIIASVYFITCIIVNTMFLMNMTIAVMLKKYEELGKRDYNSKHSITLRKIGTDLQLPQKLIDFIIESDKINSGMIINKQQDYLTVRKLQSSLSNDDKIAKKFCYTKVVMPEAKGYYGYKITRICYWISKQTIISSFILLLIVANTFILATDQHPPRSDEVMQQFRIVNYIFTGVFTLELVIKLVGLGLKTFIKNYLNILDILIILLSLMEIILQSGTNLVFTSFRTFRLFRLIRILKLGDFKILIDSISYSMGSILNYMILLVMFIYVYALLGMQFFAGHLNFDIDGTPNAINGTLIPRTNFDNLLYSSLTVFQVIIGYNWKEPMYNCIRATSYPSWIYFMSLQFLGYFILLKLFLAILLGNFTKARDFSEKKRFFLGFSYCKEQSMTMNDAIDCILGDLASYVKSRILNWDASKGYPEGQKIMGSKFDQIWESNSTSQNLIQGALKEERAQDTFQQVTHEVKANRILPEIVVRGVSDIEKIQEVDEEQKTEEDERIQVNLKRHACKEDDEYENNFLPNETLDYGMNQTFKSLITQEKRPKIDYNNLDAIKNDESAPSQKDFKSQARFSFKLNLVLPDNPDNQQENEEEHIIETKLFKERAIQYCQDSSLFIFNKHSKLRQWCLMLVTPPDIYIQIQNHIYVPKEVLAQSPSKFSSSIQLDIQQHLNIKKNKRRSLSPNLIMDYIMWALILLQAILIVMQNPLQNQQSREAIILYKIDLYVNLMFALEALIKIIAFGFIKSDLKYAQAYLRSIWNIFDLLIILSQFTNSIYASSINNIQDQQQVLKSLKALTALRALRPLRIVHKIEDLRIIVNSLIAALPSIANVIAICGLILLVFGIIGVRLLKGKFYYCNLPSFQNTVSVFEQEILVSSLPPQYMKFIITKNDCLNNGGDWANQDQNFDNIQNAMFSLFQMITTEGWTNIMYCGIDSTAVDYLPQRDHNKWMILYFVGFMIVGFAFMSNLFAGVVIDNFNLTKEREELGNVMVTDSQRSWIEIQKLILKKKLYLQINKPTHYRKFFYRLVQSKRFNQFISACLFMNIIVSSSKYYTSPVEMNNILEAINDFFSGIFNLECFLKLLSFGKNYFYDYWNIFDFFVVVGTDVGIIFDAIGTQKATFSTVATIIRGFRVIRIFRLMTFSKHIRIVLDTVINILPQVWNVMLLMFIILFIYAALGVHIFCGVMYQDQYNEDYNFRNFGNAIVLLFKCSTGEKWYQIMFELANKEGYQGQKCDNSLDYQTTEINGCGTSFSYVYFITFVVIVSWLIMNLSIAVVIEGLESARKENMGVVEGDDLHKLLDLWKDYDPKGTGWITQNDLVFFLYELPHPLGRHYEIQFGESSKQKEGRLGKDQWEIEKNKNAENQQKANGSTLDNRDRFLLHTQKQIIISQLEALQLLKDLDIRVQSQVRDKQIHFKDVFKSLIKRVYNDKDIDYKLAPALNRKMKKLWLKRFKDLPMKRSERTAREEQALQIITMWMYVLLLPVKCLRKKQKETQKINHIFNRQSEKRKYIGKSKLMTQEEKEQMHKLLRDSLSEIFGKVDNADQQLRIEEYIQNLTANKDRPNDQYTWTQPGGGSLLHKLHSSCLSDSLVQDEEEDDYFSKQNQSLQILMKYATQSPENKKKMLRSSKELSSSIQNLKIIQNNRQVSSISSTPKITEEVFEQAKRVRFNTTSQQKFQNIIEEHKQSDSSKRENNSEEENASVQVFKKFQKNGGERSGEDNSNKELFEMKLFNTQLQRNTQRSSIKKVNEQQAQTSVLKLNKFLMVEGIKDQTKPPSSQSQNFFPQN